MKPVQKPLNKEKPLDVEDFLGRVRQAIDSKDYFQLGIYRSLFHKFPRNIKAALKREGVARRVARLLQYPLIQGFRVISSAN